jgi:signal recognition particle subunit SRP19
MKSKGKLILWPIYFDISVSLKDGRRVPKNLAIRSPRIDDIVKATIAAGLNCEPILTTTHPRYSWQTTGCILINSKDSKSQVIRMVASKLSRSS